MNRPASFPSISRISCRPVRSSSPSTSSSTGWTCRSVFTDRFHNDDTGAPAYDPAILLKVVLFAYSRGITPSQDIERACRENVVFIALSADSRPHFTTIAKFISSLQEEITTLFRNILMVCAQEGLIGQQMFAVDGCKLSANCAKEWSGTHADLRKKKERMEQSIASGSPTRQPGRW